MKKSSAVFLALVCSLQSVFAQSAPAPIKVEVPYVQYLKLKLDPADLSGNGELVVQNTDKVIDLKVTTRERN